MAICSPRAAQGKKARRRRNPISILTWMTGVQGGGPSGRSRWETMWEIYMWVPLEIYVTIWRSITLYLQCLIRLIRFIFYGQVIHEPSQRSETLACKWYIIAQNKSRSGHDCVGVEIGERRLTDMGDKEWERREREREIWVCSKDAEGTLPTRLSYLQTSARCLKEHLFLLAVHHPKDGTLVIVINALRQQNMQNHLSFAWSSVPTFCCIGFQLLSFGCCWYGISAHLDTCTVHDVHVC